MAAVTTPATASTLAQLDSRVALTVGDVNSTRFSEAQRRQAVDDAIAEIWRNLAGDQAGPYLVSTSLSYTAGAEYVALAEGILGAAIYKVEDYSDSTRPVFLYWSGSQSSEFPNRDGWYLVGNNIALLPKPQAAKTLRIWTVKHFPRTSAATTTDTHPLPVNYEELIVLGAAIRLQEFDGEVPPPRLQRYLKMLDELQRGARRYMGTNYIRNNRRLV